MTFELCAWTVVALFIDSCYVIILGYCSGVFPLAIPDCIQELVVIQVHSLLDSLSIVTRNDLTISRGSDWELKIWCSLKKKWR